MTTQGMASSIFWSYFQNVGKQKLKRTRWINVMYSIEPVNMIFLKCTWVRKVMWNTFYLSFYIFIINSKATYYRMGKDIHLTSKCKNESVLKIKMNVSIFLATLFFTHLQSTNRLLYLFDISRTFIQNSARILFI